jgi:hypothetical protein
MFQGVCDNADITKPITSDGRGREYATGNIVI